MSGRALLLFPPNWSACVSGPHLALPLLAGAGKRLGWQVEVWDLSEEFYRTRAAPPPRDATLAAALAQDCERLDQLYFAWEDQLQGLVGGCGAGCDFGLLSGYDFPHHRALPLAEAEELVGSGTVYTEYFESLIPRLLSYEPEVVGVTIASQEQVVPSLELLRLVRAALPEAFLILGGNVVTRLRNTTAFRVLKLLADQVVIFQGEMAFQRCLTTVGAAGATGARSLLPEATSDQWLPPEAWPVPSFEGLSFAHAVGVPVLPYVSTRGCYWGKCHFCAIPAGWSEKGYGGTSPPELIVPQLARMAQETGVRHVKFVDEAMAPAKARLLAHRLRETALRVEWEGYARLEKLWENQALLEEARAAGLRKLYFGLEQAPGATRDLLNKNDRGAPLSILSACRQAGVKVHLFCMVGHPGTSREDAKSTVRFLIDHQELVDTTDLVGFRLDRGTRVPGVRAVPDGRGDWAMSARYEPTEPDGLNFEAVLDLEAECQEELWEAVPRLLHPLYRIMGHWDISAV